MCPQNPNGHKNVHCPCTGLACNQTCLWQNGTYGIGVQYLCSWEAFWQSQLKWKILGECRVSQLGLTVSAQVTGRKWSNWIIASWHLTGIWYHYYRKELHVLACVMLLLNRWWLGSCLFKNNIIGSDFISIHPPIVYTLSSGYLTLGELGLISQGAEDEVRLKWEMPQLRLAP